MESVSGTGQTPAATTSGSGGAGASVFQGHHGHGPPPDASGSTYTSFGYSAAGGGGQAAAGAVSEGGGGGGLGVSVGAAGAGQQGVPLPVLAHPRVVISDNSRHCVQAFDRLRVQREQARYEKFNYLYYYVFSLLPKRIPILVLGRFKSTVVSKPLGFFSSE